MAYININKPTGQNYQKSGGGSSQVSRYGTAIYGLNVYNGTGGQYTNIGKPTGQTYTKVNKPTS